MLAGVVGSFTDRRETLAALDPRAEPGPDVDLGDHEHLWFDYVADTGDGFAHSYPVAWALAHDELAVEGDGDALPAGRLLVFGGDEVYPVATDAAYRDRLVGVFGAAMPWRDDESTREAVAIPGNHDWYDGLGAFSRVFCQQRWIGGWRTHQRRSYFGVRLPHHWWLWGVDIALTGLVDRPQLDYFTALAGRARDEAAAAGATPKLVIATAEPTWLDAHDGASREARTGPALNHLERRVAAAHGMEVAAVLAGDKHFYARFEPAAQGRPVRVVSGGGGAFLHPTDHVPDRLRVGHVDRDAPDDELSLAALSPTRSESRRLRLRALWCGFRNGALPVVTAAAYLAWLVPTPARFAVAVAALVCAVALARRPTVPRAMVWAVPHAAAHVASMWLATVVVEGVADDPSLWWRAIALAVAGGLLAPLVLGAYFIAVGTIAGVNDNEAFAAIRVREHKGFLRMHVDSVGTLTMYAIGVDDAPPRSAWHLDPHGAPAAPWFTTERPPRIRLLDGPVELGGRTR
jgi:3',5'-cyclic AMP phosphodiesterase CpdA